MRKISYMLLACALCAALSGCGSSKGESVDSIDVDLTQLSSTMVYSEVSNMSSEPDSYEGKIVKMTGSFTAWHDDTKDKTYYTCLVSDATSCCAQGLEFVLKEPREETDYPKEGEMITVVGTFGTYEEDGYIYCQLSDAKLI